MLRAIIAAAMAAIRSMARWCSKTGTWIQERVVEPGVEYFHQAVAGASQAVTGLVPDVIKGAFRLPGQVLRGTGALVEGGGKLTGATLSAVASVPAAVAAGLAGGRGGMPAPAPQSARQAEATQELAEVMEGLEARRGAREMLRSMRKHSPVSLEADLVHRYAAADTYERDAIPLDELPPHLADWLETLDEKHLQYLAQSVDMCEQAVSGRRTGLVGMPLPVRPTSTADVRPVETIGTIGQIVGDPVALNARIAAAKGIRTDRRPN
ncbi:hypothetical protein [Bosea sp. NPDC055594]